MKEGIFEAAEKVVSSGAADAVEAVVNGNRRSTVRFANSVFHQGGVCCDCRVYIRAVLGRRAGVASTNSLDARAMKECLERAVDIAGRVRDEPFPLILPMPQSYSDINSYFEETASMTERQKTSIISKGFKKAASAGVLQSGALITDAGEIAVANSNGVRAWHRYTFAHFSAVSTHGDSSGFKSAISKDVSKVDVPALMDASFDRCLAARSPRERRPGVYRVLLEPPAVSELLYWLSYIGFGAKNLHEGTSFLSGRIGEMVTGEGVTIIDDGLDARGMSMPFDMEGTARRKLVLIENGAARGAAYDSFTASAAGVATTGNAPFPDEAEGPLPDHLIMEGGRCRTEDLLEMLGTGIAVKSFHYVNGLQNPSETVMTGMTRHGTFFVDNGKVKYPVRSMRFTENILKAFERIEGLSEALEVFPNHSFPLSSIAAPYVLIDGFSFTS